MTQKLVYAITNPVSMNDLANTLLAHDYSCIMARDSREVKEVAEKAEGLILNLGIPSKELFELVEISGKVAMKNKVPILIDPVGYGFTSFRKSKTDEVLNKIKPTIIRANTSEMLSLIGFDIHVNGVDANLTKSEIIDENVVKKLVDYSKKHQVVLIMTGKTDYLVDGEKVAKIDGGSPKILKLTGMGDVLDALIMVNYLKEASFTSLEKALKKMKEAAQQAEMACGLKLFSLKEFVLNYIWSE